MKVLTIAIPFQLLIDWFTTLAFFERLADPQATLGWVMLSRLLVQSADPAPTDIVRTIAAEHPMHVVDQVGCAMPIEFIASQFEQRKKIANGKCISPQVSLLIF
jgi:hypothetical protein